MEKYLERNELELYTYFFSKFMNKLIEVHCNNINIEKGKRLLTSFPSDEDFSIKEILVDGEVESYIYNKIKAQNLIKKTVRDKDRHKSNIKLK